jgi:hypothetical protein
LQSLHISLPSNVILRGDNEVLFAGSAYADSANRGELVERGKALEEADA